MVTYRDQEGKGSGLMGILEITYFRHTNRKVASSHVKNNEKFANYTLENRK